jgi:Flp pilus assembly protein TadG
MTSPFHFMKRRRSLCGDPGAARDAGPAPRRRRGVSRCRRGAVTTEFGLVFLPFLIFVLGLVEVAWQATTASLLDAAALRASRFGVTGQARLPAAPEAIICRSQTIPWLVSTSTGGFLRPARLTVTTENWSSIAGLSAATTAAVGAGQGGQVVTYTLRYTQPYLTFGWIGSAYGRTASLTHQAVMVVKNEPFSNAIC